VADSAHNFDWTSVQQGEGMVAVDFGAFIDELATVSGDAIRPFFRTTLGVEDKIRGGAFDPVTAADRAAESAMRAMIRGKFPAHGIVGEEFGAERPDAEFVWVLDPIDGTKSFISGMPAWGTLIALTRGGQPVFGMVHQPFIGERFTGDNAAANYHGPAGDRALLTRPCTGLRDAVLYTTSPRLMNPDDRAAFAKVEDKVRLSRYGGDCYAYCMLAAGHVDLVIETELKPHDVAALIPIIVGAGGIMTTWTGEPAEHGGRIVAAGDRGVHEAALAVLREASSQR
jgi:myo-inositol-1(or 4)-monophosphatase